MSTNRARLVREDFLEEAPSKSIPRFTHLFIHAFRQSRLCSWRGQEMEGPVLSQDLEGETPGSQIITRQQEHSDGGMNQAQKLQRQPRKVFFGGGMGQVFQGLHKVSNLSLGRTGSGCTQQLL